jgi:hypothetical protein
MENQHVRGCNYFNNIKVSIFLLNLKTPTFVLVVRGMRIYRFNF